MFLSNSAKFRSVRQTNLECSDRKQLTIVDPDKPLPEKAFILRLPNEILAHICNVIAISARLWEYIMDDWKTLTSLAVVCHRFSRIVLPFLCHTIRLKVEPPKKSSRKLHASLQSKPSLRGYCKKLVIFISHTRPPTNEDFSMVNYFISHLTKVQSLSIHGVYDINPHKIWALIQDASHHMHELDSLTLGRHSLNGLYLREIVEQVDIPSIRKLNLYGVYRPHNTSAGASVLEPKKHRTAAFTSLYISDYEENSEATQQLIQWPKSLVHFHFNSFYNNPFYMDLPMFGTWLSIHKDTLKSIHIGYLSGGGEGRLLDVSGFPKLEALTLSRWQLAGWRWQTDKKLIFSPVDADLLLAPNLRTFGLEFTIYDQHTEGWEDFGDPEEHWIMGFAKAAIARKAMLRKVQITFTPDDWRAREECGCGYPWDRMDKIRDEIQPYGLTLEYNQPTLTKEEWLQAVKPRSSPTPDIGMLDDPEEDNPEPTSEGRDIGEYFHRVEA